jgi:hypothetical protein
MPILDKTDMILVMKKLSKEEEELLFNDLSQRLRYKVKCNVYGRIGTLTGLNDYGAEIDYGNGEDTTCEIQYCKPYLRSMRSITEQELHEVQGILGKGVEICDDFISIVDSSINSFTYLELQSLFDWLNKKMFDYRGLIPMGLALVAPKGMYN